MDKKRRLFFPFNPRNNPTQGKAAGAPAKKRELRILFDRSGSKITQFEILNASQGNMAAGGWSWRGGVGVGLVNALLTAYGCRSIPQEVDMAKLTPAAIKILIRIYNPDLEVNV